MSRDATIHSWPGSYYLTWGKRWENGTLSLSRTSVRFVSNTTGETLASFRLSRISELKMESSSFIFSTLTVLEEGNVKHWFGSLKPNRVVVYNVMEHFWRERLLSPTSSEAGGAVPGSEPSKGRELINLVAGAQRRLEDTGRVLSHQGEQFDSMMQGLEKMDSDLGVADKLLSELESPSWWPFSKLPWKIQQEAKAADAARAAAASKASARSKVIASIPAVVSKDGDCELKPGCLLVLPSSLEVRDAACHLLHRFERGEVDEIRVHSPYEITVGQRFIGRPDIRCRLLSAKMPEALAVLEIQYKKKVEFSAEYAAFRTTPTSSPCDTEAIHDTLMLGCQETEVPMEVPAGELSQLQVHVVQPTMTQAEAQELKQMLLQLKSLALEAETELERQDEALNVLTKSADQASMTIGKQTCRMKRLL
ncbi:synaptosomal-associated protein 47 [Corythoichthys intestinalis]|uniref:synaptosomal-associated protein 47 n=1 Tax=Corythoichthys intestinalis TaxID=161448 RepID=UPI0025A62D04|nr:synaptosomal-associated protein 47 [Corythoichthys intestinalis]XP_061794831.1 synaptosomal-associated protein 47-like isoform X2 [Nerophis lumbriciformis]